MTKLKVVFWLLVVLLVGAPISTAPTSGVNAPTSSRASAALSWSIASRGMASPASRSVTPVPRPVPSSLPSPVPPPCQAGETVVPSPPCPCPPRVPGAPSTVPCPPACRPAAGTAPTNAVPCPPCRFITKNPARICPPIAPPASPGHPAITFCPAAPLALRAAPAPVLLPGFLCGWGFHPNETVTLTATGARGTLSWALLTNSSGAFAAPLPPLLCRFAPLTLVATGSRGDRSNGLPLSATSCLPTL